MNRKISKPVEVAIYVKGWSYLVSNCVIQLIILTTQNPMVGFPTKICKSLSL